jgi:hypothetical protein
MLRKRAASFGASTQRSLFVECEPTQVAPVKKFIPAETVSSLAELVEKGIRSTIHTLTPVLA